MNNLPSFVDRSFAKALYYGHVERWVRLAASMEGLESVEEEDRKIIESRIPKWKSDDSQLRLVKLDRTWTYDNSKDLVLYKLPRLPPNLKVYFAISRTLKASMPVQVCLVYIEVFSHLTLAREMSHVPSSLFLPFRLVCYRNICQRGRHVGKPAPQLCGQLRR